MIVLKVLYPVFILTSALCALKMNSTLNRRITENIHRMQLEMNLQTCEIEVKLGDVRQISFERFYNNSTGFNQPLDKILGPLIQWLRLIAVTMETSSGRYLSLVG